MKFNSIYYFGWFIPRGWLGWMAEVGRGSSIDGIPCYYIGTQLYMNRWVRSKGGLIIDLT